MFVFMSHTLVSQDTSRSDSRDCVCPRTEIRMVSEHRSTSTSRLVHLVQISEMIINYTKTTTNYAAAVAITFGAS